MSLLSLVGLAFISVAEEKLKRIIFFMVSLAVGGLFGDAFIHLLPESFERLGNKLQASVFGFGRHLCVLRSGEISSLET